MIAMPFIPEYAAATDRFYDYCLYPYVPTTTFAGKLRSSNLLRHSFESLDCPASFYELAQAIGAGIDANRTFWGLKNINRQPVTLFTNTVITTWNYASLPGIVRLLSDFSRVWEIHFWNYWPMGAQDDKGLVASLASIRPHLWRALSDARARHRRLVVKNYPECLLGPHRVCLDNSQAATIIDKRYWEKYHLNRFGQHFYQKTCLSSKCDYLTAAYIDKFGYETDILGPLPAR
jgi:hypothetical protein